MFPVDILMFSSILSAAWSQYWTVLSPKTLKTTSGTCLLIPCQLTTIRESVLDNSPVVSWWLGSLWEHYDTNNVTHRQKEPLLEVIGDLQKKNCTSVMRNITRQHSGRYFFRIETANYSFTETRAIRINVSDSLPEPKVIVPDLREGEVGNLTCTVPAPCPSLSPNVTWAPALGGNTTQGTQLNADGTQSVFSIWKFVPSFQHHELRVNCVSTHTVDGEDKHLLSHKTVTLRVEYPPKEIHISLTGSVWLGDNLTLRCQSNANPPAVHRWFVKREGIEEELAESHVLSFIAAHDDTGEYICEAQNLLGKMNSTSLMVNVQGKNFNTFLSILGLFFVSLLFSVFVFIIDRRRKEPSRCLSAFSAIVSRK